MHVYVVPTRVGEPPTACCYQAGISSLRKILPVLAVERPLTSVRYARTHTVYTENSNGRKKKKKRLIQVLDWFGVLFFFGFVKAMNELNV